MCKFLNNGCKDEMWEYICGRFYRATIRSFDLVAQLVEQYTFNVWALGSSPSGITKQCSEREDRQLSSFSLQRNLAQVAKLVDAPS
jgi:hypothetical protein